MSGTRALSAMKRKLGADRGPTSGSRLSMARGWHMSMPRVVDDLLGLELKVLSVQESQGRAETELAEFDEASLLLLMRDGKDRCGICALESGFLAAVIEMHMTGAVGAAPPSPRRPTPTDAAIVSGLVDAICAAFDAAMAEAPSSSHFTGLRYGGFLADRRAAVMALPEGVVHRVRVTAELGNRARQGHFALVMPPLASHEGDDLISSGRSVGEDLLLAAMEGQVSLDAVLHRFRLPLALVRNMQAGDVLPIPAAALLSVSVEAVGGHRVARARLGQIDGRKALRLNLDPTGKGCDAPARATETASKLQAGMAGVFGAGKPSGSPVPSQPGPRTETGFDAADADPDGGAEPGALLHP
jgi:flagellar motor switch protein FliM